MNSQPAETPRDAPKPAATHRWLRPLLLLVVEFLVLAVPFDLAYGFAMDVVYRSKPVAGVLFALVAGAVLGHVYHLWARFVARRDSAELAVKRVAGFGIGAAIGAGLMCAVVACIALAGDLRLSAGNGPAAAGLPGVAVLAAIAEELIARGVILRNLENLFGSAIAIVVTGAIFGALHYGNPHATWLSTAAVGIEGGVMLSAVYVATRSLWWTIGVHMAWNFTQTTVFGIADSGHGGSGFFASEIHGPEWLTGGVFGVETSLLSVVACAIVAAVFLVHAARKRRFIAPIWSRTA
jgi:membrane protease YdiL (CAAX protease family)